MTLEEFLKVTARRLPTASELIGVCDRLGIGFGRTADGRPVLKYGGDVKGEALALVAILRREPWRTQVIDARLADKPAEAPPPSAAAREWAWKDGHRFAEVPSDPACRDPAWHPAGAWWWKLQGEAAWQLVPGREEYAKGHSPPGEAARA